MNGQHVLSANGAHAPCESSDAESRTLQDDCEETVYGDQVARFSMEAAVKGFVVSADLLLRCRIISLIAK